MFSEWAYILAPLPQGRYRDGDDVQPVIKIGAESAFFDHAKQRRIGRRDYTHVDTRGANVTQTLELPFLQHPQQLGLESQRHLANLVQEQRSALGDLELSWLGRRCPRECAFDVSEEFTLQQVLGQSRTVHSDERPGAAVADTMNEACEQFLAGATFSFDQDISIGACRLPRALQCLPQGRRGTDDLDVACILNGGRLLHAVHYPVYRAP